MQERKQVGLCLIATNKYKEFVQQLVHDANFFFCIKNNVTIILFTDEVLNIKSERIKIIQLKIPPYRFPHATLFRYKIFNEHDILLSQFDQIFYSDVDMKIVDFINEEVLSDTLTGVHHPGYINGGWGSPNNSLLSTSYLPLENRINYFAGGFQGGNTKEYLEACKILSKNIKIDEDNGIMAEWHDETHWNWYLNYYYKKDINYLSPSYCYPENVKWFDYSKFQPKIVALNKDHKTIRE